MRKLSGATDQVDAQLGRSGHRLHGLAHPASLSAAAVACPCDDSSGSRRASHRLRAGVTLTKWTTIWLDRFAATPLHVLEVTEQDQRKALDQRLVDLCFVRLPIGTEGLHLIPMYDEVPVAWVSKEHPITAFEGTLADLAAETVLTSVDSDSVNRVALETAVLLVPMSVARSHSRRDPDLSTGHGRTDHDDRPGLER